MYMHLVYIGYIRLGLGHIWLRSGWGFSIQGVVVRVGRSGSVYRVYGSVPMRGWCSSRQ
jgi:hypothetical protein